MAYQTTTSYTIENWKTNSDSLFGQTLKQVAAATSGSITDTTTYPVADQDGLTSLITIDGGAQQTVTFSGATTTAASIVAQMNAQLTGCSVAVVGGQVKITSDSTGITSSVAAAAGTGGLTWDTPVAGTGGIGITDKTLVSQDPSTGKWVALTDVTATDGTQIPSGIYEGVDVTAAALEAGDVTGKMITVKARFDEDQLVFQNGVTYTDVITAEDKTVRLALIQNDLVPVANIDVNSLRTT